MIEREDQDALLQIVGPSGLLFAPEDKLRYEIAARYGGGKAAIVVRPADTEQVSAVLRHCVRRRLPFTPQSGNTGLVLGSTPDDSGRQIVLSLDRLRGPPHVEVDDRTATVAAGVRLSALNAALEPHNLFLPIDVSSDPMIGGMVATNTGGARYLRYGDMRRHVLGLEVVLPDDAGTVLKLSRGLRKDNANLSLHQLFIGSCGAFGIITAATLEVHPRPRQSAVALLVPRDEDAVFDLLTAFEAEAGEFLTAFEGMSEAAMRHAIAHVPGLRNPFPEGLPAYAILVELTSTAGHRPGEATLDSVLEAVVTQLAERPSAPLSDVRFGQPERLWALRHSLSEGLRAVGDVVGFDLSLHRSEVMPFRRVAIAQLAAIFPEYEVCDFGHIADGGVHFNLVRRRGTDYDPARVTALRDHVLDLAVRDFGASFSGEHGIGRANQAAYDQFTPALVQHYSAAIAAVFARMPAAAVRFGPAGS
ncbi:MAG TPA: FAD-binding oxidoreductase [Steroidobacteraceae bacterium]|nr:FAD-binding oxidoreductase [Steroidobacteraceae bacterium]